MRSRSVQSGWAVLAAALVGARAPTLRAEPAVARADVPADAPRAPLPTRAAAPEPPVAARRHHGVYAELLGAGGLGSLNYQLRPVPELALRAGLGGAGVVVVPLSVTVLAGGPDHYFELGGGVSFVIDDAGAARPVAQLGYRYMPHRGRPLLRATFTPFVGRELGVWPFGGLSLGVTF